jgi:hypothetical protein
VVRALQFAREARRDADVLRVADDILAQVREMRPAYPREVVTRTLARKGSRRPDGGLWTGPALARDGFVEEAVLERTPRRRDSDDLVTLVAMAVRTLENPTLANIARHLEHLHCRTPCGETRWSISSAQNLLAQAVEQGLLPDRPSRLRRRHFGVAVSRSRFGPPAEAGSGGGRRGAGPIEICRLRGVLVSPGACLTISNQTLRRICHDREQASGAAAAIARHG